MMGKTFALSVNAAWNLSNFRIGLIRRLLSQGDRVVAITPADASVPTLVDEGVEHVALPMDVSGMSPAHDLLLLTRYYRVLKRLRPDAYLGWTIKANVYGSLAASALGIPVINNVSGLGTAFLGRRSVAVVAHHLYRLAFRRSSTVFFQNPQDRELFVEERLVRADQATVLPGSGIDVERFKPRETSFRRSVGFTFLLVGRLLRDKGIREYLEAARWVRATHPNARFALLGAADAQNRTAISAAELFEWNSDGVIDYLGSADDVRDAIADADCVVLPSYREGMPRTLLEAAAMGKPLVATDVPGCREIAREDVNAMLCRPRNAASLADAMLRMIALSPAEHKRMGEESRRIAVEEFAEERVIEQYLAAIDGALKR